MRRIQVTTTGMALRAVLTALAVYALVLQALFPLSAAVAAANGQTVSICVTTPDPTPAGKNGAAGLGHDCLACCRIMASAALPGPVLSPEPVQLAFFAAGEEVARQYGARAHAAGCSVIDLSGGLEQALPVVPEANAEAHCAGMIPGNGITL